MKILVIGATGQIGRRLMPKLISDSHSARALGRSELRARALAGRWGRNSSSKTWKDYFGHAFEDIDGAIDIPTAFDRIDASLNLIPL